MFIREKWYFIGKATIWKVPNTPYLYSLYKTI